jgi:PIN domain nuclease of toxin-antitoxin system
MKALLDTHTFLWWNTDDGQLSALAREIIANGDNEIYVSAASAWEISIKAARGRLVLPEEPGAYIAKRLQVNHFQPLPIQISHAAQVYVLPRHHDDPFDRLLVAQAQMEKLALLTVDPDIQKYEVETVW